MHIDIVWWDLAGSAATVDSLRAELRADLDEGTVGQWAQVAGLRLKFWMADGERGRWGAVMVWETARPEVLPPNRAAELIGYPATHRTSFEIEAVVEGAGSGSAPHGTP
ncbi:MULTISPECIES: hypothetical protein [unclassified Streptomyces]|uniref:hypothetical protein n=1 Tax=unclassified Streptomyces TaxID=2593676 RepID=UPI0034480430